jgi:hypothetical protein
MAPGALYAQDCVARGAGLTRHDKNTNMTFTIFTMDVFGNPLGKGGALFIVNVTDRFNGTPPPPLYGELQRCVLGSML